MNKDNTSQHGSSNSSPKHNPQGSSKQRDIIQIFVGGISPQVDERKNHFNQNTLKISSSLLALLLSVD